jgi:hypothetical protein
MAATYFFWHGPAKGELVSHSAMVSAESHAEAAKTFAEDVIYQERIEDGHRILVLGGYATEEMEQTLGHLGFTLDKEMQDTLQTLFRHKTPVLFTLTQQWVESGA